MSHITKASTKVSFKNEDTLKKALEMLGGELKVGNRDGYKTYSVPIISGRMLEFRFNGEVFEGYSDKWGIEEKQKELIEKIEGNYVATVASKWLTANRYSSSVTVENGRVLVAGRKY